MPQRRRDPFVDPTNLPDALQSKKFVHVNPYFAALKDRDTTLPARALVGEDLRSLRGRWADSFPDHDTKKKVFLEIGCYKGATLLSLAETFPEYGFVGFDITYKRVFLSADRARQRALDNVLVGLAHLNEDSLPQLFGRGELDGILIFFPDPWSKKRQLKQRLMNKHFISTVTPLLSPDGFIWIKTDAQEYFSETTSLMDASTLQNSANFPDLARDLPPTSFEEIFLRKNLPIYQGLWTKAANAIL